MSGVSNEPVITYYSRLIYTETREDLEFYLWNDYLNLLVTTCF
jgi:hypothetical protein